LYAFEDTLQKIPVFTHVQPLNERKINPGRPEISFAMNFDYLPAKAVSGPAAIASAAAPGGAAAPAAHAAAAGPAPPPAPARGAATQPGPRAGRASGAPAATWKDGPNFMPARPPIVPGMPARRDPNQGVRPATNPPPAAAPAVREPVPASRLDVPLKFTAKPVGEVYAALGVAHGVTFMIDPAVDRRTTVTADLSGKNLKEALALVSKLAGHKVQRK